MTGLAGSLPEYGDAGFAAYLRRAMISSLGFGEDALDRPIVGITNTASDFNACHSGVPAMIESVKRGVLMGGGLPLVFPTMSLHETTTTPTSMLYRNLMAMETEASVAAQPMDSVVLIGGCDKTVPAQIMAATTFDVPAIQLVTGPMSTGTHRGRVLGACTDCRLSWARFRAGTIDEAELAEIRTELAPTAGTCMVMGTASTMACLSEVLGLSPAGSAALPAVSAARLRDAEAAGTWAATAAAGDESARLVKDVLLPGSVHNAMVVLQALGGSTNAVVHLAAIARRAGVEFSLGALTEVGRKVPVLVDLKPSGERYMADFHAAGGLPALLDELRDFLDLDAPTIFGDTIGSRISADRWRDDSVIRSVSDPVRQGGAIAAVSGNLAPRGAIVKRSAASPALLRHSGRAVVFDGVEDLARRLDDPSLDLHADDVLVLRGAGPVGGPGMPEAGSFPIPRALAEQGVTDMVRISDARMSGTSYGTVVLHVTPESAVGGPLALLRDGDLIHLDVDAGLLEFETTPEELRDRRAETDAPAPVAQTGWTGLYIRNVLQADEGCDLDL